jgi:hypothetical protein
MSVTGLHLALYEETGYLKRGTVAAGLCTIVCCNQNSTSCHKSTNSEYLKNLTHLTDLLVFSVALVLLKSSPFPGAGPGKTVIILVDKAG